MANVRVHNLTGFDLDTVIVYAPTHDQRPIDFGALTAGSYSAYHDIPDIRRYARMDVTHDTTTLSIQPFDLVGEEPLPAGEFSYELSVAGDRLIVALSEG